MSEFKVGDKVILHEHEDILGGGKNWVDAMRKFIGQTATLTIRNPDKDMSGNITWKTDITTSFHWRECSMTLVGALQSKPQASGAKCTRCLEWYEYAVSVPNFKCYGCRH